MTMPARLSAMLAEPLADDVPLYGSHGFPYLCGATPADFAAWASSPLQRGARDYTITAETVGGILASFCDDCPLAYKRDALSKGECISPVLDAYRANRGGSRRAFPAEVWRLVKIEGRTVKEVMQILDVKERTVRRALAEARAMPVSRVAG